MHLHVIGSGSSGNCYIMTASNGENIIIEQGIKYKTMLKAMDFDLTKTQFGLCTHLHKDHSVATKELMGAGIPVIISKGEYFATGKPKRPGGEHIRGFEHNAIFLAPNQAYVKGDWKVWAFNVNHDTPEPLGFLISHPESGLTLFLTDTYMLNYTFDGLNNLIIEANYCEDIMAEKFSAGDIQAFLRDRICTSHLSLNSCLDILKANDITRVNNILLIHLSDRNSDAKRFKETVYRQTLKNVNVAEAGLKLKWNKTPFG